MGEITAIELSELQQLESRIEHGLETFVDVGLALMEIRDRRLYRQEYSTFEDYCHERWGMSRPRAYQLMEAAETTKYLSTMVDISPSVERQARPLTVLEPEQQQAAWQRAVEIAPRDNHNEPRITAAIVQQAVDEIQGKTAIKNPVLYSSETNEWYTPNQIIFRVLKVMGLISLDSCSNSHEKPNVPAEHHFTIDDDGLVQEWFGKVYMNPPYGREIQFWIEKIVEEYNLGNVEEAIALVPARTDTEWFRLLRDYPRCFIWGRLKFSDNGNAAPFPSMAVYLGNNLNKFVEAFKDIGDVYAFIQI